MKWFKRLFGKRKSSAERKTPTTPAKPAAAPVEVEKPEPAKVEESAAAEPTTFPADDEPPADPAINTLDREREVAKLPESPAAQPPGEKPANKAPAKPATETAEPAAKPAAAPGESAGSNGESAAKPATTKSTAAKPADAKPAAAKPAVEPTVAKPAAAKPAAAKPAAATSAAAKPPAATKFAAPEPAAAPAAEDTGKVAEVVDAPAAGEEGPFGPGSATPLPGGVAPGEEFTVKGKRSSKLFHTAESPYFGRTKADVWFKSPEDATRAGFNAWNHKRAATKN